MQLFDSGTRIQGQVERTKGLDFVLQLWKLLKLRLFNLEISSLQLQPRSSSEPSIVFSAARLSAEVLPQ